MPTYSHSRISTFEQCPLKFKFNYIDEVETEIEETVEAFLGKRVHEALHKLYKDLKFQKLNTLKELLEYYSKEWDENWNDSIVIVRKEYKQENFRKMGEEFITDYYNHYAPFNHTRTIGLETEDKVAIDDEGKYLIHVRIDRLSYDDKNSAYEIHDYKTANTLPTQDKLDADRQLALYAYGIKKMYPDAHKIRLIWHYLAFDKELSSERTDDQLENLRGDVLKAIASIESCDKFIPKESALCNWCQFQTICPNFKHLFQIENKETLNKYLGDDGVILVNKYAKTSEDIKKLEEDLQKIREALVEFTKRNKYNVVYGSDVKARVNEYENMRFPKKNDPNRDKFVETIRKLGLYDRLASIDVYELAIMINKGEIHPELLNLLNDFIRKEKTIRIYLGRK